MPLFLGCLYDYAPSKINLLMSDSEQSKKASRFTLNLGINEGVEMLETVILVVLVLMLLGALPTWPHSKNWGYAPSGSLGLVVLILIILIVMGRI